MLRVIASPCSRTHTHIHARTKRVPIMAQGFLRAFQRAQREILSISQIALPHKHICAGCGCCFLLLFLSWLSKKISAAPRATANSIFCHQLLLLLGIMFVGGMLAHQWVSVFAHGATPFDCAGTHTHTRIRQTRLSIKWCRRRRRQATATIIYPIFGWYFSTEKALQKLPRC